MGVSPNAIRAERSEQEVAAAGFPPQPGFLSPFGTAGQAGPWHTETLIIITTCHAVSDTPGAICRLARQCWYNTRTTLPIHVKVGRVPCVCLPGENSVIAHQESH